MKVKVKLKGGIIMDTVITGRFISELRKEKGLTQAELAEKLKVTDKAVSKWETGRSAPDVSLLIPLSENLGVTVTEILKGERISTEVLPEASNEVIVKAIKEKKHISKRFLLIAGIIIFVLICLKALSYPASHFLNSATPNDDIDISEKTEQYIDNYYEEDHKNMQKPGEYIETYGENGENLKIIKRVEKDDLYFFLMQSETRKVMAIFEKDKIFKDRIRLSNFYDFTEHPDFIFHWIGDTNPRSKEEGKTFDVHYGYDIKDKEYDYTYHGVRYTKKIENGIVFEVFVDNKVKGEDTHARLVHYKTLDQ